jgi:glycosyltransferase involved in cell wall biosynthesis
MVTSAFPDTVDQVAGGVQAAGSNLVRGILGVDGSIDIHVIRTVRSPQREVQTRELDGYTLHDIGFCPDPVRLALGVSPQKRIHRLLDDLSPDVVHVQATATLVDGRRYPSVLTVHGIAERDALFTSYRTRRLRSWILRRQSMPARARYRHIITLVAYVRAFVEGHCDSRFHLIPNAIEPEWFDQDRREDGPIALFAGRFRPLKNIHGLIEAMRMLKAWGVEGALHLAGRRHDDAYGSEIDQLVARYNLEDRVIFLGQLDRTRLMEQMRRARCLVLPSFQEVCPMAIVEAGAMGVPCVASPVGGIPEMISSGSSGILIDPTSPESIAGGIRPLMEGVELADRLGGHARALAQQARPEVVAQKTLEVYDQVMVDWRSRR